MLIMQIKNTTNRENIKHKSMKIKIQGYLTTQYMVLFQSSFVILCSTYGSLWKFATWLHVVFWTCTHKHQIISIQYPPHKCLPEKSCLDCLRILIMSWLFTDPLAIMKEIMSWLIKDPLLTVTWLNFNHAQSKCKKWPKKIKLTQMKFFLEKQLIKFSCTY